MTRDTRNNDPTPGERLKRAIHAARARAGISSDMELGRQARVHYDTLQNWYSGRTVPRPASIKQVADVLGVRYAELLDVYEGRDADPPELKDAVTALVAEIRAAMVDERRARAVLYRTMAAAITTAMEPVPVMDTGEPLSVPSTSERRTVTSTT
jgi:hypothetical protein